MKTLKRSWIFLLVGLFILSCRLPGFIPLPSAASRPLPEMEKDGDALVNVLKGQDWYALGAFVKEQYTDEELSRPGTIQYTAQLKGDKPVYFSYGWCATTEAILQQNYQHISVELFVDGEKLGSDAVHSVSYRRSDGLVCGDYGVLFLKLDPDRYQLKAAVHFDEKVNDGVSEYVAGDYVYDYDVTVTQ